MFNNNIFSSPNNILSDENISKFYADMTQVYIINNKIKENDHLKCIIKSSELYFDTIKIKYNICDDIGLSISKIDERWKIILWDFDENTEYETNNTSTFYNYYVGDNYNNLFDNYEELVDEIIKIFLDINRSLIFINKIFNPIMNENNYIKNIVQNKNEYGNYYTLNDIIISDRYKYLTDFKFMFKNSNYGIHIYIYEDLTIQIFLIDKEKYSDEKKIIYTKKFFQNISYDLINFIIHLDKRIKKYELCKKICIILIIILLAILIGLIINNHIF